MSEAEKQADELIAQLWAVLEPVVLSEGMELVEVEYRRESQGWVLRLFVDQDQGVSVNDCARISHLMGDVLDVSDLITNPYHLEVSSPGLNRPLRKGEHFDKAVGSIVDVKTTTPLDNRRRFKGTLVDTQSEKVIVNCDGHLFEIPLELIERARLCYFESLEQQGSG